MAAVLEAGRWTGSAKNRQGWAFVVVDDRAGLERLATAGDFTGPVAGRGGRRGPGPPPRRQRLRHRAGGAEHDAGRRRPRPGSCPITLHRRDRAREILAVPEGHEATWAIALGYPNEEAEPEQRRQAAAIGLTGRRPLADLVHRGRFGGTAS